MGPTGFLTDCQSKRAKSGVLDRLRFDRVLSINDITKTAAELPAHFRQLLNGPAARKSAREKARHKAAEAKKQDRKTLRQVTACLNAVVAKVEAQAKRERKKQRDAEKQDLLGAQRAAKREAKKQRAVEKAILLREQQAAKPEAKKQRIAYFPSRYHLDCGHCGRAIHVPTQARGTRCPQCKQVTMAADHFAQSDQPAPSKMAGGRKWQRGHPQRTKSATVLPNCRCGAAGCWC